MSILYIAGVKDKIAIRFSVQICRMGRHVRPDPSYLWHEEANNIKYVKWTAHYISLIQLEETSTSRLSTKPKSYLNPQLPI